ncbi:MAG: hypothetical protein ACEPOV_03235 [Hyphomicrobiales bacterium]
MKLVIDKIYSHLLNDDSNLQKAVEALEIDLNIFSDKEFLNSFLEYRLDVLKQENIRILKSTDSYIDYIFQYMNSIYHEMLITVHTDKELEKGIPGDYIDYKYERNKIIIEYIINSLTQYISSDYVDEEIDILLVAHSFNKKLDEEITRLTSFGILPKRSEYLGAILKRHIQRVATKEGYKHYESLYSHTIFTQNN